MRFRIAAVGLAVGLLASLGVASPSLAATASTCSSNPSPVAPKALTDEEVYWAASGTCSVASALEADLMHYYAPPIGDARVNYTIDTTRSSTNSWSTSAQQCDNGGSTTYYTRAFWKYGSTDGTKVNSANRTFNHC